MTNLVHPHTRLRSPQGAEISKLCTGSRRRIVAVSCAWSVLRPERRLELDTSFLTRMACMA
jgi:hypothetical protein